MEALIKLFSLTRLRTLFYVVSPNETMFENLQDVPDYLIESTPWFIVLMVSEMAYSYIKKKDLFYCNDGITNGHSSMLQQDYLRVVLKGAEFSMACWIYEKYGLHFLPWNSLWTWIISFLFVDMSYYWFHRGAHEINFFWAFHQVHHSSEHYNLTTASRQSMFQQYIAIFFHLPEAFILPPSAHLAHLTLNKINQFWVHTQVIKSLGPLEHILVTPSHHRVHHGRNRYCIDKNYSGTFIIWDKIFGTFQAEKPDEPVVYGLVHNIDTFNQASCQFSYLKYLFLNKLPSMTTFGDKMKALVYGPGWFPGKPRLGDLADIPDIKYPVVKYDHVLSTFLWCYTNYHFGTNLFIYFILCRERENLTYFGAFLYLIVIMFSAQSIGAFLDNKSYAPYLELFRCAVTYYFFFNVPSRWPTDQICLNVTYIYAGCFCIWFLKLISDNLSRFNVKLKRC